MLAQSLRRDSFILGATLAIVALGFLSIVVFWGSPLVIGMLITSQPVRVPWLSSPSGALDRADHFQITSSTGPPAAG
jgi:hypothetical protein